MDYKKTIFDRFLTKNKDRLASHCLKRYTRRIKKSKEKNQVRTNILTKLENNLYEERNPFRRFCSILAIQKIDGKELISKLENRLERENEKLKEKNKWVRWSIIFALRELGTKNIEVYLKRLKDENEFWRVKDIAIHSLRNFDDIRAIPLIVNHIDHKYPRIRWSAVIALGELLKIKKIPDKNFKDYIKELLKPLLGSYPEVCWRAAEAIGKIGENAKIVENVIIDLRKVAKSKTTEKIRGRALLSLGEINATNSLDMLIKIIINEKESIYIRQRAAAALADIASKSTKKSLINDKNFAEIIKLLEDENIEIRVIIAWLLSELGNNKAIVSLKKALEDNKNKGKEFWFAISLAKLEGVESDGHQKILKMIRQKKLGANEKIRYYEFLLKQKKGYQEQLRIIKTKASTYFVKEEEIQISGMRRGYFFMFIFFIDIIFQIILEVITWPTITNKILSIALWIIFVVSLILLLIFWDKKNK